MVVRKRSSLDSAIFDVCHLSTRNFTRRRVAGEEVTEAEDETSDIEFEEEIDDTYEVDDLEKTSELSRRGREEIEKQRAHERYMKLQEKGKTDQAKKGPSGVQKPHPCEECRSMGTMKRNIIRVVEFCRVEDHEYSTHPGSGESCCKMTLKFTDPSFNRKYNKDISYFRYHFPKSLQLKSHLQN